MIECDYCSRPNKKRETCRGCGAPLPFDENYSKDLAQEIAQEILNAPINTNAIVTGNFSAATIAAEAFDVAAIIQPKAPPPDEGWQ